MPASCSEWLDDADLYIDGEEEMDETVRDNAEELITEVLEFWLSKWQSTGSKINGVLDSLLNQARSHANSAEWLVVRHVYFLISFVRAHWA